MEQWQGAGPHQCLGEEAVQSQLRSSHRNYDTFGQISRDMLERGHDWNALQCRVKVKELQNAYGKAREANRCSGGAPGTCRFYKELDAILGGDLTSTPRTTIDTSEPSSTRLEEEEEESRSKGAEAEEDTPASLNACSQELFESQKEGSQLQQPVLGAGQTPEEAPNATLRSQPSMLSPAERLQRIRKRPHRRKEDMLHEVMQQSLNENLKAQEWRESERRIRQQNEECWHKSTVLWQQSMDWLINIMECQADSIQALVAMQVKHYHTLPPSPRSPCPKTFFLVPPCHRQRTFPNIWVLITTSCLQHLKLHEPLGCSLPTSDLVPFSLSFLFLPWVTEDFPLQLSLHMPNAII
nr:zinc finger protein with KRAB and SCAN domains 2-like [Caretta caretta]